MHEAVEAHLLQGAFPFRASENVLPAMHATADLHSAFLVGVQVVSPYWQPVLQAVQGDLPVFSLKVFPLTHDGTALHLVSADLVHALSTPNSHDGVQLLQDSDALGFMPSFDHVPSGHAGLDLHCRFDVLVQAFSTPHGHVEASVHFAHSA